MEEKTFIIAEAGANHNRSFETAVRLIDVAVDAGADAVKFQTYSSETLYAKNSEDFADYKNINELIKSLELPRQWQSELKRYCDDKGIEFMSTPFDYEAVKELVALGVKRMKISGFEATDPRFVRMVAETGLPLIISAGIGFTVKDLGVIRDITSEWNNELTILHCNNAYPTPMEDINLFEVRKFKHMKGVDHTGLSDHTASTITPALAVAMGATVIEKHFTLSKSLDGPDHKFALEPDELKEMVKNIRDAEKALTTKGNKSYTESEKNFTNAMRSVVTKIPLKRGDVLTENNITTKRPCSEGSIKALNYFDMLGREVVTNVEADVALKWEWIN